MITQALDYSSAATQTNIEGIRSNLEMMRRMQEQNRVEKKQQQAVNSRIQTDMAQLQGTLGRLDQKSLQAFNSGFMKQYGYWLDQYTQDPSQENMNALVGAVAQAKDFVSYSQQAYASDKRSYMDARLNPTKFQTTADQMDQLYSIKWETPFEMVGFSPDRGVFVIDNSNGVSDPTPLNAHPNYSGRPEDALVFTPRAPQQKYISPSEYGYSKAGYLYQTGKSKSFPTIFSSEQPMLNYSIAMTYISSSGSALTPEEVQANPELWAEARDDYFKEAQSSLNNSMYKMRKAQQSSGPMSGVTNSVNLEGTTYEVGMYKNPQTISIPENVNDPSSPARTYTIVGHKDTEAGMVISHLEKTRVYVGPDGKQYNPEQLAPEILANPTVGGYRAQDLLTQKTELISDPSQYEAVVKSLKINGLIAK